jgi:hypothetical protein
MTKLIEIMKKEYIKPEIVIIQSSGSQILAGSPPRLSSDGQNTLHNGAMQTDNTGPGTGGDDIGGGDLDAAKRWNDWGDIAYKGYDPWK